jgi:hypothetical protein
MNAVGPMPHWPSSYCDNPETQIVDLAAFQMRRKRGSEEEHVKHILELKTQAMRESHPEALSL